MRVNNQIAIRLAILGTLFAIFGAKAWLIASHGSPTPFVDAWVTAARIRHYVAGTLGFSELAALHNEHRVVFPQALAVGLYALTGRWDTFLEMLVNAVIHACVAAVLLTALAKALDDAGRILLCGFTLALFAIPLGWENVLSGFQSQQYLLLLFGLGSVWLWHGSRAWSSRWFLATAAGVASYLSNASGALTLAAFVSIGVVQLMLSLRRGASEVAAIAAHAVIAALLVLDTLMHTTGGDLQVHSALEWFAATMTITGWPVVTIKWPVLLRVIPALVLSLPLLILFVQLVRERAPIGDWRWLYIGIGAWWALQIVSFAYGRSAGGFYASRYCDIFIIGILVNAACLLHLLFAGMKQPGQPLLAFMVAWLFIVCFGVGQKAIENLPRDLAWRRDTGAIQTENVRRFLLTGDTASVVGQPEFHIPLKNPDTLIRALSDPTISAALSPRILGRMPGFDFPMFAISNGGMLLPIGFCLLFAAGLMLRFAAAR
jgi:hypothetical protein